MGQDCQVEAGLYALPVAAIVEKLSSVGAPVAGCRAVLPGAREYGLQIRRLYLTGVKWWRQ